MKIKKLLLVIGCWFSRMKSLLKICFGIPMSIFVMILLSGLVIGLAGCTVRTYSLTKDRVDQDLMGNRGYIQGTTPAPDIGERATQRTLQVVEIELGPKAKTAVKPAQKSEETASYSFQPEEVTHGDYEPVQQAAPAVTVQMKEYKVQKGDTLQKISQAFYGTTKKWNKIYEANRDKLRGSDKIYPGQIINIPLEELKEPKENLK